MKLSYSTIIKRIALQLPFLIKLKRYYLAYKDSISVTHPTYSQHAEDIIVQELLPYISPNNGIFIEVGANQPTRLSNTYLFYRLGFRGIVIEPNHEMTSLFRRFRPEDIHLEIGCAGNSGVGKFKKAYASVLSGFSDNIETITNGHSWVPILTVDEIWRDAGEKQLVFLLSIDTEGFDLQVLNGALETLKYTACVIIELSKDENVEIHNIMMQAGFHLIKNTACNFIWLNSDVANKMRQA